jgi:phage baseplate assembly protein W
MAIKDTNRKPFIEDNDDNIFIGLDLPIRKSEGKEGFFASTSTTIEAVKNNIRNLVQTNPGERLMQPRLGLNLRRFLFNQLTVDDINSMQNEILDTLKFWLPFVEIRDIIIQSSDNDININPNTLSVNIKFNIKQDPNTLDSVQVDISNTGETSDTTFTGGSGY